MTKTVGTPACLTIFHITNTGNGGNIQTCAIGHILQHHWTNITFITILEELQLEINDGLHGHIQCMTTLFDGFNIITGTIYLFLRIKKCFFHLAIHP